MMDSLKEANTDLSTELDELRKELLEMKMSARETSAVIDEKVKLKKERMAQMMAGFDLGGELFSDNEASVRQVIEEIDTLLDLSKEGKLIHGGTGEQIPSDLLKGMRDRLVETQGIVRQAELSARDGSGANGVDGSLLQQKLAAVRQQYEDLLAQNLSEADVADIKQKLQDSLASHAQDEAPSAELQALLSHHQEENARLRHDLDTLRKSGNSGSATLQKQLADFDTMKKSLMRDLQNRCERVVELEISLDSTREQYNSVLRSANSKQQQKKLAFLERNLEQLTAVQRQLVEQNAQLKKEVAIAERKLQARGERIHGLEVLLGESQEKLMQANHRQVAPPLFVAPFAHRQNHPLERESTHLPVHLGMHTGIHTRIHSRFPNSKPNANNVLISRFETQLTAVKERLEAAKISSVARNGPFSSSSGNPAGVAANVSSGPFGSRIAKPLRGGGGAGSGADGGAVQPLVPTFAGLQQAAQQSSDAGKRTSWFFNQRT